MGYRLVVKAFFFAKSNTGERARLPSLSHKLTMSGCLDYIHRRNYFIQNTIPESVPSLRFKTNCSSLILNYKEKSERMLPNG